MSKLLMVALGGGFGAVARYLVGVGALRSFG
ncbi:MAG TPA: fluoride efflux transporter CrcB, partial [Caulobacteraceae bacterium]|nr:fluoride efflux transporter CrcB [Caulobacteraceae bacterium]